MDSNAGHLNNRPVHDMLLLLLPSGGNWTYTCWLADWLCWLLLTAAIYNCCPLQWLLLSATAALCNGCCYLQWLLLSAMAAAICCFWKLWMHWSGCGSPGFIASILLVFQLKYVSNFKLFQ